MDQSWDSSIVPNTRFVGLAKGGYLFESTSGDEILVPHKEMSWSTRRPTPLYLKSKSFEIRVLSETDDKIIGSIKRAFSEDDPWANVKNEISAHSSHIGRLLWRRGDSTVAQLGKFEVIVENTKFNLDDFNNFKAGYELELKVLKIQKHSRTIYATPTYDCETGIVVKRNSLELFDGKSVRRVSITFTPDYLRWFKKSGISNGSKTQIEISERAYSFVTGNPSSGNIKVLRVFLPPDVLLGYQNLDIPMWQDKYEELMSSSERMGVSVNAYAISKLPELLPFCSFPRQWSGFIDEKIRKYLSSR